MKTVTARRVMMTVVSAVTIIAVAGYVAVVGFGVW